MSILDIAIFFVSANNKRKFEEQATEELYTSSFEEIPENGSIADKMIQEYKKTVFWIRIRIRIIWLDPDPDPYQEALIWIRVVPKDYSGKKSIFLKNFNFFVTFLLVSEYIINIVYKL